MFLGREGENGNTWSGAAMLSHGKLQKGRPRQHLDWRWMSGRRGNKKAILLLFFSCCLVVAVKWDLSEMDIVGGVYVGESREKHRLGRIALEACWEENNGSWLMLPFFSLSKGSSTLRTRGVLMV